MHDEFQALSLISLILTIAAMRFVGWLFIGRILKWATDKYKYRKDGTSVWREIPPGGGSVGALEQIAFLLSILIGAQMFIGAWLVFKVAAKWESWSNMARLPDVPIHSLESDEFEARYRFGTWLLNRFLMGTLLNVLLAGLAAWFYYWLEPILDSKLVI